MPTRHMRRATKLHLGKQLFVAEKYSMGMRSISKKQGKPQHKHTKLIDYLVFTR